MCQTGVKECLFHFVMECDKFNNERQSMLHKIESSVTDQAKNVLINLPKLIYFYILCGMDYTFSDNDMSVIRKISVLSIYKMYMKRKDIEYES